MNNIFNSFINSITPALLIPLLGTIFGSACVFFMGNSLNLKLQKALQGFASGVMVAASIWSLLLPAFDLSSSMGKLSFIPALVGFWVGIFFLLSLDHLIPHLHLGSSQAEGVKSHLKKTTMMIFAVTIHNLPEGMAVGVVYAGFLSGNSSISAMGALSLALGIAIQNFPEGAIISMPLKTEGISRRKSFVYGTLSGVVEPLGAFLMIVASSLFLPVLPYFLAFATGAMIYVVVEELIPEMSQGVHSDIGTTMFALGFTVMMTLDVVLG
ncbi:ZIP family metal transporter [Treponema pectinovorum]|uniref:ZIP family metal transporter n=1 Tax=Treponema pectinovorum TaxID=164 RepID=UPI003D8BF6B9